MRTLEAKRNLDALESITRNRTIAPQAEGINDDVILRDADTGEVIAAQVIAPELSEIGREIARHLRFAKLPWTDPKGTLKKNERLSGIGANTVLLGYTAPNKMYKRYAGKLAPIHIDTKPTGDLFMALAPMMWKRFQDTLPAEAKRHDELTRETLHEDWLMARTPFSSGVVNDNAVLPYHKDAGNIKDAWSMMLVLRNKVDGGYLHVPEYETTLGVPDLSLMFFCGQSLMHGVTPMVKRSSDAYRYSIVYYTKTALRDCGSAEDEIKRAQIAATMRASK
jgi:hypothetical protein